MRTQMLSGALAAAGLVLSLSSAHAAKTIKWSPTFKAAMESAKTGNKLVMVDFYTEW
jgi:thiol:disulfide interchange protein